MAGGHHLVVLLPLVLDHQFDLILQAEEEENGFFSRHTGHLHIVDLTGWGGVGGRERGGSSVKSFNPSLILVICDDPAHLENLVSGDETLQCGWASGLDGRYEDADLVASGDADAHRSFLLEADESRLQPVGKASK